MIKVNLQYRWQSSPGTGQPIDENLFRVLLSIAECGSIAGTSRRLGISYRHVWGLVGKWGKVFGQPLAELRQGHGASLTDFGRRLLWAEQLVQARLTHQIEDVRREIEQVLAEASPAPRLTVCASHDLALAALRDRLAQAEGLKLDLRFQASLESLAALAKNQCVLAGFHVAEGMEKATLARFRRHLKQGRHALVGVATRTQGLMLARGNPKSIASLADLAGPRVRFINRQRGSGSRVEFDQLLSGAGIDPASIEGYGNEEFTHVAVAATIASGKADAGFGIRAAAAQYELEFVPLLSERYYLAYRTEALEDPLVVQLVELLRGEAFRTLLGALPGYGTGITGVTFDVSTALSARGYCISKAVRSSSKKVAAKRATAL